jgi:hypothetical protein
LARSRCGCPPLVVLPSMLQKLVGWLVDGCSSEN